MCDHCSKVTSQKGYAGQVTCKCEHGEKKNGGEGKDKDFGGCCSRKEKKTVGGCCGSKCCSGTQEEGGCCTGGSGPKEPKHCCAQGKTYKPLLEGVRAAAAASYPRESLTVVDTPRASGVNDSGCCSWRRRCCNGGCCNQVSCCSSQQEAQNRPSEKPLPTVAYGYSYNQTGITSYPLGMAGISTSALPERIPCTSVKNKLPMCFGGECKDSEECENRVSDSTSRQSDR